MADSYNHIQGSTATTWTITHNMDSSVVVMDVYVDVLGVLTKIIPQQTKIISVNTVEVSFTVAQKGAARLAI